MSTLLRILATLILCVVLGLVPGRLRAEGFGFESLFGFRSDDGPAITISDRELQSLGCLTVGAGIAVVTVVFSGAAIVVSGGQNAATASVVALPVLAATMAAGCAFGSQAVIGLAWLARNSEALFGKVIDAIPPAPQLPALPVPR